MKQDNTKARIMDAAMIEFLINGYDRASMNGIVKRSGITKGGIYHYFSGKETLLREIVSSYLEEMASWTDDLIDQAKDARELFQQYFRSILKIEEAFFRKTGIEEINPFHYFKLMFDAMSRFPDLRRQSCAIYERMQEQVSAKLRAGQLTGLIRSDLDTDSIAYSFNALYEGTIMLNQVDGNAKDKLQRYIENLWNLITVKPGVEG